MNTVELRDYFAGQAMKVFLSEELVVGNRSIDITGNLIPEQIAEKAYKYADVMMKTRVIKDGKELPF